MGFVAARFLHGSEQTDLPVEGVLLQFRQGLLKNL